jgi:hypothetical protein
MSDSTPPELTPAERLLIAWFFNLVPHLQDQKLIPADIHLVKYNTAVKWKRQPSNGQFYILQYSPVASPETDPCLRSHLGNLMLETYLGESTKLIVTFRGGPLGEGKYVIPMVYNVQAERELIKLVREHVIEELVRCLNKPPLPPERSPAG